MRRRVHFEKAIRLSPLDPINFNNLVGLASARLVAGDDGAAADLFIRALQERPNAVWIHRNLPGRCTVPAASTRPRCRSRCCSPPIPASPSGSSGRRWCSRPPRSTAWPRSCARSASPRSDCCRRRRDDGPSPRPPRLESLDYDAEGRTAADAREDPLAPRGVRASGFAMSGLGRGCVEERLLLLGRNNGNDNVASTNHLLCVRRAVRLNLAPR